MKKASGLLGLIGIVLLVFAGVRVVYSFAFRTGFGFVDNVYLAIHAGGGLLLLIAYFSAGLENLKEFLSERSTRYGTSTIAASLFFVGILVAVNYLSARHHHRFDLTESKVYSLSPQSENVVKGLADDLKLYAFVEGGVSPELRDLFESYRYASDKVSFEIVDPDRRPELAQKLGITTLNSVYVEYGESKTTVTQPSEETITNAIIKVTRKSQQVVCFVEGHGEPDIDAAQEPGGFSELKEALANENYQVKKILLATMEKVPDDCSALVVASARKSYLEHEVNAVDQYLRGGRHAIFFLAPQEAPELKALLAKWGVQVGDDVVVDQVLRLFQGPALGVEPLVNTYDPAHEITRDMQPGQRSLFPMTRSVGRESSPPKGIKATELVKTGPSSWAESDLDGLFNRHEAQRGDDDRKGPVPIAVAVEANLKEMGVENGSTARLAVFGSVDFAANRNLGGTYFNRDLVLNTFGWLVGQTDLVSIRAKGLRASRVNFDAQQAAVAFYLSVLLLPELLLIAGLAMWWRRE